MPETEASTGERRRSPEEGRGLIYAVIAVMFMGSSAVMVRLAAPVSAFEIACGRLLIAAAFVISIALVQGQRPVLPPARWPRFALYGLITTLHFTFYIVSLSFTSITHSLALVYTSPIFVTLFSALWLQEPIPRRRYGGIALAVVGITILSGFEPTFNSRMLLGDLLAVASAVCYGFYSIVGRSERAKVPLLTYTTWVYSFAALWLLPIAIPAFILGGGTANYSPRATLAIIGLGLLPLGIGHTLYNAAIRRIHATYANLIVTQEVTFAVLLGILVLNEWPSLNAGIGAIVALIGIALVLL